MPLTREIIRKYRGGNRYFIETGTYEGDTVLMAVQEGFEKVFSIELNENRYIAAVKRFENEPKVKIVKGDSSIELPAIIKDLNSLIFFWLDAHLDGPVNAPLFEELNAILQHPIKNHTILIDDVRRFGEYLLNASKESLSKKLLEINSRYVIRYENDGLTVDDVMAACL